MTVPQVAQVAQVAQVTVPQVAQVSQVSEVSEVAQVAMPQVVQVPKAPRVSQVASSKEALAKLIGPLTQQGLTSMGRQLLSGISSAGDADVNGQAAVTLVIPAPQLAQLS